MNRKRLGGVILLGVWATAFGIVMACGSDDTSTATSGTTDGGVDSSPTSTTTSTTPPPDSSPPDAGPGDSGRPDARAIWAFRAYCGEEVDASCPAVDECPSFDGGGVAAQDCTKPFDRCVSHPNREDAGIADRVFACESVATPTWETNRLCAYESCDGIDAGDCPSFDGGIDGQECSPPRARCQTKQRVFICQGNGGLVQAFNGYCDAGLGTRACNDEVDACAPVDGGSLGGSTCEVERARCYGGGSDGNKIFVCARR